MLYLITYRKNHDAIQLEWIVPSNYSEAAIRQAFYCQYPETEIVSLAACGEGCVT